MKKEVKIPGNKSKITRDPFTGSEKIYVQGKIFPDVKVAMRKISLADSKPMFANGTNENVKNEPIVVYDASGPFTDPKVDLDVKKGIPALREKWIRDRDDIVQLDEISSEYGRQQLYNSDLDHLRFQHLKKPLVAKEGMNVSQMHYAKKESSHRRWSTLPFVKIRGSINFRKSRNNIPENRSEREFQKK